MFNLTKQERLVILFLAALALMGVALNFWVKMTSRARVVPGVSFEIARVNLNKADKEALLGAPGIGEKLAQRILDYRAAKGGFRDVAELKCVEGINAYRYEKLRDYFAVE